MINKEQHGFEYNLGLIALETMLLLTLIVHISMHSMSNNAKYGHIFHALRKEINV